MKKQAEIVPANKSLKINFYILIASYILLLILLEPIIDYFLLFDVNSSNLMLINELSQKKIILSNTAYGTLRMLPMLWLVWFGYRVLSSARLPPARMSLPLLFHCKKGVMLKSLEYLSSVYLYYLLHRILFM